MSVRNNGDFRERIRQNFTRQAAMETIGAELTRVEHGVVEIELPFDVKLTQQHGFFMPASSLQLSTAPAALPPTVSSRPMPRS
ncbi:hypothetical protein GGE12_002908 [Rhizobium mongolense]|uniref:Uncharacterized protein n=1 Tax=Rhizobium mongolense TaxID=57676 RepID=A0A7W6RMG5_9HYPH|nr:hypothetical protein [Rhizobium mongolense]